MASINKTFCQKPRAFIERKVTHQKKTTKLLQEYEKRLRRGDNANPSRYLAQYRGPDKEVFRIELNLVTLLVESNKKRSQEWTRLETTGKIQKASDRIMTSLIALEKQTTKTTEERQKRKATKKEKVKKQEGWEHQG